MQAFVLLFFCCLALLLVTRGHILGRVLSFLLRVSFVFHRTGIPLCSIFIPSSLDDLPDVTSDPRRVEVAKKLIEADFMIQVGEGDDANDALFVGTTQEGLKSDERRSVRLHEPVSLATERERFALPADEEHDVDDVQRDAGEQEAEVGSAKPSMSMTRDEREVALRAQLGRRTRTDPKAVRATQPLSERPSLVVQSSHGNVGQQSGGAGDDGVDVSSMSLKEFLLYKFKIVTDPNVVFGDVDAGGAPSRATPLHITYSDVYGPMTKKEYKKAVKASNHVRRTTMKVTKYRKKVRNAPPKGKRVR